MLKIRLARFGKNKQPSYRIIVNPHQKDTKGKYIESIGFVNYQGGKKNITLDKDKAKEWIAKGAQLSSTVHNLFVSEGIVKAKKFKPHGVQVRKSKLAKAESQTESADKSAATLPEAPKTEVKAEPTEVKKEENKAEATEQEKPEAKPEEKKTESKPEEKPAKTEEAKPEDSKAEDKK